MSEYTDRLAELERLGRVDRELAWCVAQLRERDRQLAEARELLATFLDGQPEYDGGSMGDGGYRCRACRSEGLLPEKVRHATNCPVLRKDAILGRQASEPTSV